MLFRRIPEPWLFYLAFFSAVVSAVLVFLDSILNISIYSNVFFEISIICLVVFALSSSNHLNKTHGLATLIFVVLGLGMLLEFFIVLILYSAAQVTNFDNNLFPDRATIERVNLLIGCGLAFYLFVWKSTFMRRYVALTILCLAISGWYSISEGGSILFLTGSLTWLVTVVFSNMKKIRQFIINLMVPANSLNLLMIILILGGWLFTLISLTIGNDLIGVQLILWLVLGLANLRRLIVFDNKLGQSERLMRWGAILILALIIVYIPLAALKRSEALLPGLPAAKFFDWQWILLFPVMGIAAFLWANADLDWRWKSLTVGSIAGVLLTYVWFPFVYASTYNLFVPGIKFVSENLTGAVQPSLAIGLSLILLLGPLTTVWAQPNSRKQALAMTGLSGLVFSLLIFSSMGALIGIVAGQNSIYEVAYSRNGYYQIGFVSAVANAVLYVVPWIYGTLLTCLSISLPALILGAIVPVKKKVAFDLDSEVDWNISLLILFLLSTLVLVGSYVVIDTLVDKLLNSFESIGGSYWWKPEWMISTVALGPFLLFTVVVLVSFIRINYLPKSYSNSIFAFSIGTILFVCAGVPYFLLAQSLSTFVLALSTLILIGISLAFLRHGKRLLTAPYGREKNKNSSQFFAELAVSLPIVMVSFVPFVIMAVGLAQITIVAIPEMQKYNAAPPGRDWLQQMLETAIQILPQISVGLWIFVGGLIAVLFVIIKSTLFNEVVIEYWLKKFQPIFVRFWDTQTSQVNRLHLLFSNENFRTFLFGILLLFACILNSAPLIALVIYIFLKQHPRLFPALRWSFFILAGISLLLGIALYKSDANLIVVNLLVGASLAILYRGVIFYNEGSRRDFMHFLFFLGLGGLIALFLGQTFLIVDNGVASLQDAQWQNFGAQNSPLVENRSYQVFQDSAGALWFVGHYGPDAIWENNEWTKLRFSTESAQSAEGREARLSTPGLFVEKNGNYWFASQSNLYKLEIGKGGYALKMPNRPASGPIVQSGSPTPSQSSGAPNELPNPNPIETRENGADAQDCPLFVNILLTSYPVGNECPFINSIITSLTIDKNGDVWVGTNGAGVVHFENTQTLDDARWEFLDTTTSGILSNKVAESFVDSQDNLWFLSESGVSRLAQNGSWSKFGLEQIGIHSAPQVVFEDNQQRIWLGASAGTAVWDGKAWQAFSLPPQTVVYRFYQDRASVLWVLTSNGAYQFQNGAWSFFINIPADPFWQNPFGVSSFYTLQPYESGVREMLETENGIFWFGGPRGLLRFEGATQKSEYFYPSNSGIPSEDVKGFALDSDGALWVTTYSINRAQGSNLPLFGFAVVFIGIVLGNTFIGYQRSPNFKSAQLIRRVSENPDRLLPEIYETCKSADADQILANLTNQLKHEESLAMLVSAYLTAVAIGEMPNAEKAEKAGQVEIALLANEALPAARELMVLYEYFSAALQVQTIADIGNQPVRILRSQDSLQVSIATNSATPFELPGLVNHHVGDALEMLGKVSNLLKRYLQVESTQDRLSYLADSLSSLERARRDSVEVTKPEQGFLVSICELWQRIMNKELDLLSGHADLRIEFRTRQIKHAEKVTLVLMVKNVGSALADHIQVTIRSSLGSGLLTNPEVVLDHLSAGESKNVEFALHISEKGDVRVLGDVSWSDRIASHNQIDFADVIRLYETSEKFELIPNPFIVGHPVKSANLFQGREDVFEFIRQNLSSTSQAHTLVLYGQRRTGKTSILYQIYNGKLGDGFIPVLIDVQELAPAINHMSDFFQELALHIVKALKKSGKNFGQFDEQAFVSAPTRAFSRFLDEIEEHLAGVRIVLMFDEFELIEDRIKQGRLAPEALGYLRSLIQHKDYLAFVFTGTHKLEQMSADYWSVFFNIALHLRLSFMKPDDATRLIREPIRNRLSIDDLVVEKIISLTHGHPYFIQLLCWGLVNHCNKIERNYATLNELNVVVADLITSGEAYFAFVWQLASPDERLAMAALALCTGPGKSVVTIQNIMEACASAGVNRLGKELLVKLLDGLVDQEILSSGGLEDLQYSYQVGLIEEWVKISKPLRALVERGQ